MKLVEYIENPNFASKKAVNDNLSMASSSIYTSPEKSIGTRSTNEGKEGNDENSTWKSIAFSIKSFEGYGRRVARSSHPINSKNDVDSVHFSSFIEPEPYNMLDIERQLDDISIGVTSKMSNESLWHTVCDNRFQEENNMLRKQQNYPQEEAMNSCLYFVPTSGGKKGISHDQSSKKKSARYSLSLISFCVFGTIGLVTLLVILLVNRDGNDVALNEQVSVDVLSVQAPTPSPYTYVPTLIPTYVEEEDECIDDNEATIRLGTDHRDCAWLAMHEASQIMFCHDIYPLVYNVCKATCGSCNNQSSLNGNAKETPTAAPTMVETLEVATQSPTSTTLQQGTSPQNDGEQGVVVCIDDLDTTFAIDQYEQQNCTWLASHPASQIIFCRPDYYPLVYDACRATCKKCN